MGFWDDMWDGAGKVADKVGDFFTGDDQPKAKPVVHQRPEFSGQFDWSRLNAAYAPQEHEFEKRTWLTGGDPNSLTNSWNTPFLDRSRKYLDAAIKDGSAGTWFKKKDATGVMLWDYDDDETGKSYKFGDVYEDGKFLGNVYEHGGNEVDADLLMSQLTLSPEQQNHVAGQRDPAAALKDELARFRDTWTENSRNAETLREHTDKVEQTQGEIADAAGGWGDDLAAFGTGFLGGAAEGAGIGWKIGKAPGALIGGAIGGVASGAAAWLNRDSLSEQMANAYEVYKAGLDEENGGDPLRGGLAALGGGAGLLGRGMSPLSNLTQGVADSERGDGVGAMQNGEDTPEWLKPLDILASIGDAALQFGTTPARSLYVAQMGGHATSKVGSLTIGTGDQFDDRTGEFRNVYSDEDANAVAAWGSALIDAGQTASAGAMMRWAGGSFGKGDSTLFDKLLLGGAAGRVEQVGARRFLLDDQGRAVKSRWTGQMLVPSEAVKALSSSAPARRAALSTKGQSYADDLYRAATALERQEAPIKAAWVNAFAEGTEEGVQEALDSVAMGHQVEFASIRDSFFYGSAMGLGMSVGANIERVARKNAEVEQLAARGYEAIHGKPPTKDELKSLRRNDREAYLKLAQGSFTDAELSGMRQYQATAQKLMAANTGSDVLVAGYAQLAAESMQDQDLKRSGVSGQQSARLFASMMTPRSVRDAKGDIDWTNPNAHQYISDDSVGTHDAPLRDYYVQSAQSTQVFIDRLEREKATLGDDPASDQRRQQIDAAITLWRESGQWQQRIADWFDEVVRPKADQIRQMPDGVAKTDAAKQLVVTVNQALSRAFDGYWELDGKHSTPQRDQALRQAAAVIQLRSPISSVGTYTAYRPALHFEAVLNDNRGMVFEPITSQDKRESDYDGDRSTFEVGVRYEQYAFERAATGLNLLVPQELDNGRTVISFKVSSTAHDKALGATLRSAYDGTTVPVDADLQREAVVRELDRFSDTLMHRYNLTQKERRQFALALRAVMFGGTPDPVIEPVVSAARAVLDGTRGIDDPIVAVGLTIGNDPAVMGKLAATAEANGRNEVEQVVTLFRTHMYEARGALSTMSRATAPDFSGIVLHEAEKPRQAGSVKEIESPSAGPLLYTLAMLTGSDSLLRISGAIKYQPAFYKDAEARSEGARDFWFEQAGQYLNMVTEQTLTMPGSVEPDTFDVQSRVTLLARQIIRSAAQGAPEASLDYLTWKLMTSEFRDQDGRVSTVAQMLTSHVLADINRQVPDAILQTPEKQQKLNFLRSLAADARDSDARNRTDGQRTLLREMVGGLSLADIVPDGVLSLGVLDPGGTIDQNIRILRKLSELERREFTSIVRNSPEYTESKAIAKEDREDHRAVVHEVVDFILESASTELSFDTNGAAHGSIARANESGSSSFKQIQTATQQLLKQLRHENRTPAGLQRVFRNNPQVGRQVYEALMHELGLAGMAKDANGDPVLRAWVLDALVEPDFEKAEMILWRGRLASAQQHFEGQLSWKDTARPKDTLLELIHDLTNRGDVFLREELLKKFLDPAMTRREFEQWVAASIPAKPNPVLMYEADPGTFSAEQPSGGWGALGDTLRSKLALAADSIHKLPGNLDSRKKARSLTIETAKELESNPLDPRNVALDRLIDGIGPNRPTLVPEALVSALSKLPLPSQGAHTKGVAPSQYRALAQQVVGGVMRFGFYDASNRMMNSLLGTVSVVDVMSSPELIFMAKNLRDELGREIALPFQFDANGRPTRESILAALQDEAISDLVTEALLPRTYTHDPATDALIPAFADATNLHEALSRPAESAFVPNQNGGYTKQADFEFGLQATVRAQQKNPQDPNPFERLVTRMVLAQLTGLQKPNISQPEIASIVVDSWTRLGRLLRMTAQLRQSVGETQYQQYLDEVLAEQTDTAVAQINRRNNELGTRRSPSQWVPQPQRAAIEKLVSVALKNVTDAKTRKKLKEVMAEIEQGVTPEREVELEREVDQLAATNSALFGRTKRALKAYLSGDVYGMAVASYHIPAHSAATATDRKTQVALYLDGRYDIADRLTGDDRAAVLHVIEDSTNVSDSEWELLSRVVISHIVESAVMPGTVSGVDLTVVNDVEADAWAFDPTWRAQLSFLRDTSLPLLASAEEMVAENNTSTQVSTESWKNLAKSLFHPERNPMWTPAYAALSQAVDGAFGAATAGYVISAAGNNSKVQHATATASRYTWDLKLGDDSISDYAVPVTLRKTPNGMVLVDHSAPGYLSIDDMQGVFGRVTGTTSTPPEQIQTVRFVQKDIPGGYSLFNLDLLEGSLQTGEEVQLEVFVPNHRPDGWQWQNNIFFNGFPAPPSPVVQYIDNPIGALTYVEDGVNNREQRYSLDAPKKKRSAAIAVDPMINMVPDLSANRDPSEALHLMARRYITEDLGYGRIGSVNYKAALAALKMHMLVQVTHQRAAAQDGTTYPEQTELVSMDRYLSLLRQDPKVQIASAKVVPMDRRTANTFYGETGSRGLNAMGTPTGNFGREGVFDPTRLSEVQQRLVKNLTQRASLGDSMLAARNGMRRASRSINTDLRGAIDGMERFARFMQEQAQQIPHRKKLSHDGQINLLQTRSSGRQMIWRLENEALAADKAYAAAVQGAIEMTSDPKLWGAPGHANEYSLSMVLLPGAHSNYDDGVLSDANIQAFSQTVGFTFGDQVGIPLSKFEEAYPNDDTPGLPGQQVVDALPYFIKPGVELKLIGGSPSLRRLVEQQLQSQGYGLVTGERNVWAPRDVLNTLQIASAYEGMLWRQSSVAHSARHPVFYPYPGQHEALSSLTENMGYMLNPQQRVIADTQMLKVGWSSVAHLIADRDVPSATMLIDGLIDEQWDALGQETKGNKDALDVSWDASVADIRQRSKDGMLDHWVEGGQLLGSGQFTVYVVRGPELRDGDGFALYLHREGAEVLSDDEIMAAYKKGHRVIVGPSESSGNSVLAGRVVGRLPARSDSTIRLRVASTLGDINSKGMTGAPEGGLKTMWAQAPEPVTSLFSDPLLPGNEYMRDVALKAYEDADKKLNLLRAGRNFRELASFIGTNLMPLFYEGLYREAYPPPNQVTDQHLAKMQGLRDLLLSVPTTTSSMNEVSNRINELAVRRMSYDISEMTFDLSNTIADQALRKVLERQNHTEATIALFAAIEYLSASGTDLRDISGTPGFGTEEMMLNERESNRMPTAFSQVIDKIPALRTWAAAQMSARLGSGWYIDPESWDAVRQVRDANGNVEQEIRGILEYSTMANTGETTDRGFDPSADRPFSLHEQQFAESLGGITWGHTMDAKKFREMLDKSMAPVDKIDMYSVQHRATARAEKKHPGARKPWTWRETIAEKLYRVASQTKLGHYLQPLGLDENYTDPKMAEDLAAVKAKITELADRLFVNSNHSEEHFIEWLVRLRLGRPGASKAGEADVIPLDKVMLSLRAIESSIGSDASKDAVFRSPLFRGVVSMVPLEITVAMWRAYEKKGPEAYSPRLYTSKRSVNQRATTFDEFVKAFVSESLNDELAMHAPAVDQIHDAILHQYQSRLPESLNLPVSLRAWDDILLLSKNEEYRSAIERIKEMEEAYYSGESDVMPPTLADFLESNPELRHISVNRLTRTELRDQVTHDYSYGLTMQQIVGEGRTRELFDPEPITERERAYAEARWNKWHLDNNIPFAVRRQLAKGYAYGVDLEDSDPKESVYARPFLGIRYMLAMLNPGLAVAGGVEAVWKSSLINGRKAITGESTGLVGRNLTRIVDTLAKQDNGAGVIARGLGLVPIYTDGQLERRAQVIRHSATTTALSSIIHQDLGDYGDSFNQLNRGLPQWMIKASKFAGGMQDLARGTRGKRLTALYIDSVVGRMRDRGYSVDQVLERLAYDPIWVQKEFPEVHKGAIQQINDMRGVQPTVISHGVDAFLHPLTTSPNALVNLSSNLLLRMPLMFSKYAANFMLTATGLRGVDTLVALGLDGRQKPNLFTRSMAALRKGDRDTTPIDMRDVVGNLDAMDAVIGMGMTHSQLFLAGTILQGLGLSGEDEEEKRLRRQAEMLGAFRMLDPSDLENDFRNFGSLSLDFLPAPLRQIFATTDDEGNKRAIVDLHWTMKQVLMPMFGMERFFETGDYRHVWWGFSEAIGSMPLVNTMMLNRGLDMAEELTKAAHDAGVDGGPESLTDTFGFYSTATAYFENMLMESAFLNAIYVGLDPFDRNPYIHPLRDSDGDLQRDVEGTVRGLDSQRRLSDAFDRKGLGLTSFVDDEGNVKEGYVRPMGATTRMRVLSENRLGLAALSSIFTKLSGQGSNFRYSMPVVERKFDKPERSAAEQQAIVLGALRSNPEFLKFFSSGTEEGATVEEQAITASMMNFLEEKYEGLGEESAYAMFQAIVDGHMPAGSEAIQGAYVSKETRLQIQDRWLEDLTQEAVDLGLSETVAKKLAKKAWYGPNDGSAPGIYHILWDYNLIPVDRQVRYQQLNTTYQAGVDGTMWARGFKRPGFMSALGIAPLQRAYNSSDQGTSLDSNLNVADTLLGLNTGMRGLRRTSASWDVPTDVEIGDALAKAIEDLDGKSFTPGGYGSGRRRGGGGGGGYAQRPNLPYGQTPRLNIPRLEAQMLQGSYHRDVRVNNTDNPLLRRDEIQRQRFSSERGRLKSWQ